MTRNRSIIVTDSDFALLRLLASHEHLATELEHAEIVATDRVPTNVVTMNSRVSFDDATTGETREITIVFPHEADFLQGKVSVLAPVGTALLGLTEGQSIVWPFPDGSSHALRVRKIAFQPEASASPVAQAPAMRRGSKPRAAPKPSHAP
ncbi:MAG: nucleoside diphosphate kinase regulator [Burkholderiales bacterium]|nr:nucleoside diphosphate kinase regulator [Burkholderiales bacterium]